MPKYDVESEEDLTLITDDKKDLYNIFTRNHMLDLSVYCFCEVMPVMG